MNKQLKDLERWIHLKMREVYDPEDDGTTIEEAYDTDSLDEYDQAFLSALGMVKDEIKKRVS